MNKFAGISIVAFLVIGVIVARFASTNAFLTIGLDATQKGDMFNAVIGVFFLIALLSFFFVKGRM